MNEEFIVVAYGTIFLFVILGLVLALHRISKYFENRDRKKRLKKGIKIKRYKRVNVMDEPIFSLSVNSEVSGGFWLGIGSIGSDMKYYFYKEEFGGKKLDSIHAGETIIVETDKEKPKIVQWKYEENDDWTIDNSDEFPDGMYEGYILKVPRNTIRHEFNANP